jgi:hypothetical protein
MELCHGKFTTGRLSPPAATSALFNVIWLTRLLIHSSYRSVTNANFQT